MEKGRLREVCTQGPSIPLLRVMNCSAQSAYVYAESQRQKIFISLSRSGS